MGDVWKAINPIFLGCSGIAVATLWGRGSSAERIGAVFFAALGTVLFVNAYFLNNDTIWEALNPLRVLVLLLWSAAALTVGVRCQESGG